MAVTGAASASWRFAIELTEQGQSFVVKIRTWSGLIVLTEMGEENENLADFVGYLGRGCRLHDA